MYAPTGISPESECSRRSRNSCRAKKEGDSTASTSDPSLLQKHPRGSPRVAGNVHKQLCYLSIGIVRPLTSSLNRGRERAVTTDFGVPRATVAPLNRSPPWWTSLSDRTRSRRSRTFVLRNNVHGGRRENLDTNLSQRKVASIGLIHRSPLVAQADLTDRNVTLVAWLQLRFPLARHRTPRPSHSRLPN